MPTEKKMTGYPSIDKPWLKYYTEEAINAELPKGTAYDYLYKCNQEHLDKYAIDYFGNKFTFKELFNKIEIVAKAFLTIGVKKGDIVTVSLPNMPEAVCIFYALSKIGAISNMVDPRTSVEGLKEYVCEVNSAIVITIDMAVEKFLSIKNETSMKTVISVSPSESFPAAIKLLYNLKNKTRKSDAYMLWKEFVKLGSKANTNLSDCQNSENDAVMIVHTGGTTGSPKGVMLSNLNMNVVAMQSKTFPTNLDSSHKWLDIMPPFIAYGIGSGLHFPLCVGMCVTLIPKFDADKFDELLIKHKPNHMAGVPSHWYTIITSTKMQSQDLSNLISAAVGGDAMDVTLEEQVNNFLESHNCKYQLTKGYGMTEVNGSIGRTVDRKSPIGSVGIPFCKSCVAIFDLETGEELPYNQIGEICMTGPNMMMGYYDKPEATAEIKRLHKDGQYWIHSGDVGYMNEDGNLFVVNRIKRLIIRFDGFKIFPSMIEAVLQKNSAIKNCSVVGTKDKDHNQGNLPIVYAVLSEENKSDVVKKELFELCQKELPEYAQPIDFVFIDKMPLTPIGKVDYRALEKEAAKL